MSENTTWSVMLVDDEQDMRESLKELIEGEQLTSVGDSAEVTAVGNFSGALAVLESGRYDLAILDVRHGDYELKPDIEAGQQLQMEITGVRFLPIIFYTGLPGLVDHLNNPPFIQVVPKDELPEVLLEAIRTVLSSELPAVNRALVKHVDNIQREYMWEFVARNWTDIIEQGDMESVAYLLARRLASSLSGQSTTELAKDLVGGFDASIKDGTVHPMQYYVMPPMSEPPRLAGDIYKGDLGGQDGYWVMLTPSCDLANDKADWLLLAKCLPLAEQPEYKAWNEKQLQPPPGKLRRLLGNNRTKQPDRYFYLPGALSVPDLVVDFQKVVSIAPDDCGFSGLDRLATLDSPFAEALVSRFTRLFGRIGTPDLDMCRLTTRLRKAFDLTTSTGAETSENVDH